jgi:ABC-type glycerol-3-phosphate transport system permease component
MRRQRRLTLIASYVIVLGALVVFLFPIVWLIIGSLKPPAEIMEVALPSRPTLQNYATVLDTFPIAQYLGNSLRVALLSTAMSLLVGSLAAYAFTRYRFRGATLGLLFVLALRMLPAIAVSIPLYLLFSRLGMVNNVFGLVLAHCAVIQIPLVIWIMHGFFQDIPVELSEAGLVDGCNRLSVLYHIILPLATPGLAVAAVFAFLFSWNDFGLALILVSTPGLLTMPVALSQMNLQYGVRWDNLSAAAVMYIIPTMIMALLLQRYITRGLTAGAVKG